MSNNNQSANTQQEIYTYKDIASILGIGLQRARVLMKTPDFPSFKIGAKVLVRVEDFNDWFNNLAGKEIKFGGQDND